MRIGNKRNGLKVEIYIFIAYFGCAQFLINALNGVALRAIFQVLGLPVRRVAVSVAGVQAGDAVAPPCQLTVKTLEISVC